MRKKKIDFSKYANAAVMTEVTGADGVTIQVRNHISYQDKVQMATDLVENCLMVHDDSCCYESHEFPAEQIKAIVKYYTDVPVDDVPAQDVANFVINNDMIQKIKEIIHDDYFEYWDIYVNLYNSVVDTFNDDRSLQKAVRTSFGFLFNGEDITESLAKAEMTKKTMFDALNALNQKEEQERTKLNDGKMKFGNNIVNFAKKE